MLDKRTVDDLKGLRDRKVLICCDSSVPLKESVIQNYNRTDGTIPTVKKLLNRGVKVILRSHLGRPKDKPVPEMSLAPITPALNEGLGIEVKLVDDPGIAESETRKVAAELKDGEVLFLQNTRYRSEGTKPRSDDTANKVYAKELANLYDGISINDTFGTAHRTHCPNVGVTRFTKGNVVGYLMEKGVKFLGQIAENPVCPFVAVLGGTEVSDKINIIDNLLDEVDTLITSGGMACIFAKIQGQKVGNSLCEADKLSYALEMIRKAEGKGVKLSLPIDHARGKEFSNDTEHKVVGVIDVSQSGFDIGPKTIAFYKEALQGVRIVVWNGPIGAFEFPNLAEGTPEICRAVADLADATTIIGGGDSVNAVKRLGFANKMTHISTGGGASLKLLEGKELPSAAATDSKT